MAEALEPATAEAARIYFELERFELTDARRLELSGRWFGIRGRRFVRPTLTLATGRERHRLLADLEHKPWPAEDGRLWHATFAWKLDGDRVSDVELSVAPDIVVSLPAPGPKPAGESERRPASNRLIDPHPRAADPGSRTRPRPARDSELRDQLERAVGIPAEPIPAEPIPAVRCRAPSPRRHPAWRRGPAADREAEWTRRLVALVVLLAVLIALVLIIHPG